MSLKLFHLVFIVCSSGLSFFFGAWCIENYSDTDSYSYLALGISSILSGVGLAFYLTWFLKKLRNVSFFLFLFGLSVSAEAFACSVCIGNPTHPMVKSVNAAVWSLMFIIGTVLVGFASVFIIWARRARRLEANHGNQEHRSLVDTTIHRLTPA